MIPSKPTAASEEKNWSQFTSPWPMSMCWWMVTFAPGGLQM